jgi:hypothetical protein
MLLVGTGVAVNKTVLQETRCECMGYAHPAQGGGEN